MENLINSFQTYLNQTHILAIPIAFIAGVLTSLTPCIYPMIPIVVCCVGGQSNRSPLKGFLLSMLYVLGMAITYAVLGAIASLTGSFFGEIQNSFWANFIVGNICLLFALSMLDVFILQIPFLHIQPKQKGGLLATFFLGMVSGLVASPCVAPILLTILTFVATKQNVAYGSIILFSFALGMGLLLVIAGTCAGILSSLPKSGNWMVKIKKIFGFILLVVAEYYLVQAGKFF